MKTLLPLATMLCCGLMAFAAPVNTLLRSGDGATANFWSLNRLPADGDTVVIPLNVQYIIDDNLRWEDRNIHLKIAGTLLLRNGKLNLGAGSVVVLVDERAAVLTERGTPADRITIGGETKYSGNEGTITGPAYLDSSTSRFTSSGQVLSVVFSAFTANYVRGQVLLHWTIVAALDANYYSVERSTDGVSWTSIGRVVAARQGTAESRYAFTDHAPLQQTAYYQIRQIDRDESVLYSEVRSVAPALVGGTPVRISATVDQGLLVRFGRQVNEPVLVQLVALSGKTVLRQTVTPMGAQLLLRYPALRGNYVALVSGANNLIAAAQVAW